MNEIELSNDLTKLTIEIKSYQNIGGQAIFEIGRRLKWVKENDLAHGEFGNWLESMKIDHTFAKRAIKVSEEFEKGATLPNLGATALYLIATMPEEEREKPQQLSSGETKTPDEMTVRELKEVKRQLKAKDDQIATQARMIDDLNEQGPKVVEVKKIPDDYDKIKDDLESAERSLKIHRSHIKQLEMEREQLEQQLKNESDSKKRDEKQDELQEMELKRLQREADINVYRFILATNNFIKEQSISAYDSGAIASANEATKEKLINSVKMLEKFIKEVKTEIKGEVTWVIN